MFFLGPDVLVVKCQTPPSSSNADQELLFVGSDVLVNTDFANLVAIVVVESDPDVTVHTSDDNGVQRIPSKEHLVCDPILAQEGTEGATIDKVLLLGLGDNVLVVFGNVPESTAVDSVFVLSIKALLDCGVDVLVGLEGNGQVLSKLGGDTDEEVILLSDDSDSARSLLDGLADLRNMSH